MGLLASIDPLWNSSRALELSQRCRRGLRPWFLVLVARDDPVSTDQVMNVCTTELIFETFRRSAAELNELFARKIKPWRFHKTQTERQAAQTAASQGDDDA